MLDHLRCIEHINLLTKVIEEHLRTIQKQRKQKIKMKKIVLSLKKAYAEKCDELNEHINNRYVDDDETVLSSENRNEVQEQESQAL